METKVEQFYFSANDIARHFGVSVSTVHRWASTGCPCLQMGATRARRFRIRDVEKFLCAGVDPDETEAAR